MFNPKHFLNFLRIEARRRKSKKRGGKLKLKIGNVPGFFRSLDEAGVEYVVLRWFEEVPLTPAGEKKTTNDIDILFQHSDLKKVIRIGSKFPGNVLTEFYSVSGKKGTAARGFPYYPPVLAAQILSSRIRYKDTFYIPSPREHFQSLCYHLVYHKGYESGLPVNASTPPKDKGKRHYEDLLMELADKEGVTLEKPVTLESLHRYLVASGWTMPYDQKQRWKGCQKEWMDHLCKLEEEEDFTYAKQLPGLIVFVIRADASVPPEVREATIRKIKNYFTVEEIIPLSQEDQDRASLNIRGGNWLEHGGKTFVPPTVALVCFDPTPKPFTKDHPDYRKNPHITNANVLLKNLIREEINEEFPTGGKKRTVLHSSDNTMEGHHHLLYVLGKDHYPEFCRNLVKRRQSTDRDGVI